MAGTQGAECFAFPRLMLTAVLRQADRFDASGEPAQQAAGFDLGELSRITDQHDLRAGGCGVVDESGEGPGADHARLVNDHDRVVWESAVVGVVEIGEETRDRLGRDPRRRLELRSRACGERGPDDPLAGVLPSVAGAVERERLARPRGGDDHVDRVTVRRQPSHERGLLVGELGPGPQRLAYRVLIRDRDVVTPVGDRTVDDPLFERQQIRGRIARE